jgi:PAS domain S-box-containing protein
MSQAVVKDFQSKYGLTNRQLALLCGCSLATIQKWRSGSVPVPGITQRLLTLIDVLFGGSEGLCDFAERFAEVGESVSGEKKILKDFSGLALQVVRDREFSRAADALEQKFQTYFESLPDMLVLVRPDGTIAGVNRKFEEQLVCRREEVTGLSFDGFCSVDSLKTVRLAIERALGGARAVFNLTLQRGDGSAVEVEASFSAVRQADEVLVIGALRSLRAVTEGRDRAERRLRYDRLLSDLIGALSTTSSADPDMGIKKILGKVGDAAGTGRAFFFQLSDDGQSIDQTVEWCAAGASFGGIELMRPTRLSIPWLLGKLREQDLVAVETVSAMEPEASVEQQLLTELGVQSALFVLIADRGNPAGIVGLADMQSGRQWHQDDFEMLHAVSDSIWAVMAGSQLACEPEFSHREFEAALQEAGIGFWQWDIPSGHTTYNGTWCAMLGYSPEEIESRVEFWKKRIHPDDFQQAIEQLDRYLRDSSSDYRSEFRIRHKDGHWIWVQSRGRITAHDTQGSPVRMTGTHLDITRQKDSELRIQAAKERTEQSNLVKSEFLSDLSHNLRTPMSSIIGTGQVLKQELQSAAFRDMADIILNSSADMMKLIDAILDIPGLKGTGASVDSDKTIGHDDRISAGPAVLIAEDNPANREVFNLMLQRLGCRTETASNGLEAVEAADRKSFDFIFMDIEMPVMNGLDAVREIRRKEIAEGRRAAIICAATAYARPGDREKYISAGMDEYLPKPIGMDSLAGILEKHTPKGSGSSSSGR